MREVVKVGGVGGVGKVGEVGEVSMVFSSRRHSLFPWSLLRSAICIQRSNCTGFVRSFVRTDGNSTLCSKGHRTLPCF